MATQLVNIFYYSLDERHAKIESPKFKLKLVTKSLSNEKKYTVKVPICNVKIALNEYEHVENIIIYICKELLGIGPIARHLFALYSPSKKVWLAANQTTEIFDNSLADLSLLVRFKPTDPVNLERLDKQAFDYYFCQMRDAFQRATVKDISDKLSELISLNVLITVIEEALQRDKALKSLCFYQFAPIGLEEMAKSFQNQKSKVNEMHKALDKGWKDAHNNQENLLPADFIKAKFISKIFDHDEYEHPVIEDFCHEIFTLQILKDAICHAKKIRFRNHYLSLSINLTGDWVHLVYLNEITFLKPIGDSLEIECKNGTTIMASGDELEILSFCALLENYYLFTVDSEKNICKCVTPPSVEMMHKYDIHGPLDFSSVTSKLKQEGCGTYLITADGSEYCYNLYVKVPESLKVIRIKEVIKGSTREYIISDHGKVFTSFEDIKENLRVQSCDGEIQLTYSLKPKGLFSFTQFPIFQNFSLTANASFQKVNDQSSEVFCGIQRYLDKILPTSKRIRSGAVYEFYQLTKSKEKFIWKVFKRPSEAETLDFLTKAIDWKSLNSQLVVQILSMSLRPAAIMTDYYPHGPLNKYLEKHRESIKIIHLLECAHFLAKALYYLQGKKIVHGNIRCRSIWVVDSPLHPLGLKLGDPFINVDKSEENLWLAPESSYADPLPLSVDVWAAATTMWEIFSYGMTRPTRSVHHLNCPFSCPLELWHSINRCWVPNPLNRESPFYLLQNIQNLIMQEYKSSKVANTKNEVSREPSWSLPKFHRFLFKTKSNHSNGMSLLDDNDSLNLSDSEDQTTWVIPSSRLRIHIVDGKEEILGRGNYGEVIKARYLPWHDRFVAVKRINTKHRQRPSIVKDMLREFEIMTELDNDNIVSVVGIVKEPEIMLVMEYLAKGSLIRYLRSIEKIGQDISSIPFVKFSLDIAKGMEYLESKKIVHRDLAARNILMASEDLVKIADFGLSQTLGPGEDIYTAKTPRYLPFRWYAPESIGSNPKFSHKSDVWSFGVTIWEIFTLGKMPEYPTINNNSAEELVKLLHSGTRLAFPNKGIAQTDFMWSIMLKCWSESPIDRPSFSALREEIFNYYDKT